MAPDVQGQAARRFVAPRALLIHGFEDDQIQVTLQTLAKSARVGLAKFRNRGSKFQF